MRMVDGDHGGGSGRAGDFVHFAERGGEQNIGDSGAAGELGFRDGGAADSDGSAIELAMSDFGAFVSFEMRAEIFSVLRGALGHALKIGFEGVEVEQ